MFYIFISFFIALGNIANKRSFHEITSNVSNSTLPSLPSFPVATRVQFADVCPITWPIQRHNLFPVTTLNDVAATLLFLEPAPVKPVPKNTCPALLPIQRREPDPITTINDVAAIVSAHFTLLEPPSTNDNLKLDPNFDTYDENEADYPYLLMMCLASLVPVFFGVFAILCFAYRCKHPRSLGSPEQHCILNQQQHGRLSRLKQLEMAQTQLAGQAEFIRSLQMDLQLSRSLEQKSSLRSKRLQAINASQRVEIGHLRLKNNDISIPPTFIPNFSLPASPSNCSARSPETSSSPPSSTCTSMSAPDDTSSGPLMDLDSTPAVANMSMFSPTLPSPLVAPSAYNNTDSITPPAHSEQSDTALSTVNADIQAVESGQVAPLVDDGGSWTVVQRRKKRQGCAQSASVQAT